NILQKVDDVLFQFLFVDDDFHSLTAEYVRWTHEQREVEHIRKRRCLIGIFSHAEFRERDFQFFEKLRESSAVFGQIERIERSSEDFDSVFRKFLGQFQSGLSAELNDYAFRLFVLDDVVNVFPENRLEIQFISRI